MCHLAMTFPDCIYVILPQLHHTTFTVDCIRTRETGYPTLTCAACSSSATKYTGYPTCWGWKDF